MKQKAIEAAQFLENVRTGCRIQNKDNLPLLGIEYDSIKDAVSTLMAFAHQAEIPVKIDEKLVNNPPNP